VRTKNAHYRAVEALSGWNFARAKRLVLGWEILGFLDEERVLAVVDGGEGSEEEWGGLRGSEEEWGGVRRSDGGVMEEWWRSGCGDDDGEGSDEEW
jgi:hypothetical protein